MGVLVNPYIMKSASGPSATTFVGNKADAGTFIKNHSLTTVPFGPGGPCRLQILVHVFASIVADTNLLAASIGGVPAAVNKTSVVFGQSSGGVLTNGLHLISADVAGGTTGTVALNFTGDVSVYLGVFRTVSLLSSSPTDSEKADTPATTGSSSLAIDVLNEGALIAGAGMHCIDPLVIAGVTQSYNVLWRTNKRAIGGLLNVSADQAGRSVSISRASGSSGLTGGLAAVALR
jgi:hypothetical protein